MLFQYGTKKLVQTKLHSLILSLKHYEADKWVHTFASFVGISATHLDDNFLNTFLWAFGLSKVAYVYLDRAEQSQVDMKNCVGDLGVIELKRAAEYMKTFTSSMLHCDRLALQTSLAAQSISLKIRHREFKSLRTDKYLGVDVFLNVFTEAMITEQQFVREKAANLFRKHDGDHSGTLDFDEFKEIIHESIAGQVSDATMDDAYINRIYIGAVSTSESGEIDEEAFCTIAQTELKSFLSRSMLKKILESEAEHTEGQNRMKVLLTDGVREKFSKYDADKDGTMTSAELRTLLIDLGAKTTEAEAANIATTVDTDNTGKIEFDEFIKWWRDYALDQAFKNHDAEGKGSIPSNHIEALAADLGIPPDTDFSEMLRDLDPTGSNEITYRELQRWWSAFDIQQVFNKYDEDNSGEISLEELGDVVKDLGLVISVNDLSMAIDRLDADDSGSLTFEEFLPWWHALTKEAQEKALLSSEGTRSMVLAPSTDLPVFKARRSVAVVRRRQTLIGGGSAASNANQSSQSGNLIVKDFQHRRTVMQDQMVDMRKKLLAVAHKYNLDADELLAEML
jgi:Ca2+-binding EF-hand superfamily protein